MMVKNPHWKEILDLIEVYKLRTYSYFIPFNH